MNNKKLQSGFVALFFVLGISFTFLVWISLSSERVFQYVYIKRDFSKHRTKVYNTLLCSQMFINNLIKSDYNTSFIDNKYSFYRRSTFDDLHMCNIEDIQITYLDVKIDKILFIIDQYRFEYKFKNGSVNSIKSFNLF